MALASFLLLLAVAPGSEAGDAPTLLAHGSKDAFWYALVRGEGADASTQVWIRPVGSGDWKPMPEIPGRTVQLADYHGELLMIFDDGQWKRLSPAQFVSGPALPMPGPIVGMAGGQDALWALSLGTPPPVASTLPTTLASVTRPSVSVATTAHATTGPATQPVHLQLYELVGGGWLWQGELPAALQTVNPALLSIAVVNNELLLASADNSDRLLIHRYDSTTRRWIQTASLLTGNVKPVALKLVAIKDRAVLWLRPAEGAGALAIRPQPGDWSAVKSIDLPAGTKFSAITVAAAGEEVRVLTLQAGDKLFEQKYGLGGEVTQGSIEVTGIKVPTERPGYMQLVLLLGLGIFVLSNLSRRKPTQVIEIEKVRIALAPLSLRLIAGLIDATPVLVGLIWATRYAPYAASWQQLLGAGPVRWLVLGSWAVYVLHTLLAELVWSRSLGKMVTGLHIVGFDGKRPTARGIAIRNVLRLLDVVLCGFSLTSVFFSPLRQRLGDIPAGTLVAVAMPKEPEKPVKKNNE